jgi:hypothetical protein
VVYQGEIRHQGMVTGNRHGHDQYEGTLAWINNNPGNMTARPSQTFNLGGIGLHGVRQADGNYIGMLVFPTGTSRALVDRIERLTTGEGPAAQGARRARGAPPGDAAISTENFVLRYAFTNHRELDGLSLPANRADVYRVLGQYGDVHNFDQYVHAIDQGLRASGALEGSFRGSQAEVVAQAVRTQEGTQHGVTLRPDGVYSPEGTLTSALPAWATEIFRAQGYYTTPGGSDPYVVDGAVREGRSGYRADMPGTTVFRPLDPSDAMDRELMRR